MAKKKADSLLYENPYNETSNPDPNVPDTFDLYWGGYDEMLKHHLGEHTMVETPNSESGHEILGGPTPGEPDPRKK